MKETKSWMEECESRMEEGKGWMEESKRKISVSM